MARRDITDEEAMKAALANLRLEGLEPSEFTHDCMQKLLRGEITKEQYYELGRERFSKLGNLKSGSE